MGSRKIQKYYSVIIFVFAFILYSNTIGHDFAWDDKIVIQENERVQEGVPGIPDLFKKFSSERRQDKYGYRPITLTTFAVDYELFGEEPGGYHFMNVLYFSLLCLLLFLVLKRIFHNYNLLLPFLITILFAAHPLHVEVVANIKSRDELLAMFFGFASLYFFIKFYDFSRWKDLLFSSLLFIMAYLSKENAITFLLVFPVVIVFQGNFQWKRFLKIGAIIPLLAIISALFLYYSLNSTLGAEITEGYGVYTENYILGNSFFETSELGQNFANTLQLDFIYLRNFIAPYPLTYYNGQGQIEVLGAHWKVISGMVIFLFLIWVSIVKFRKYRVIAFGLLFYFVTISVYLQIFRKLADTMADRFAFIPSLGLSIAFIGLLALIFKSQLTKPITDDEKTSLHSFSSLSNGFKVVFLAIIVSLSVMTFTRNRVWQDDYTLVSHDMPALENSARPHYYYASLLNEQLQKEYSYDVEKQMIHHYRRSMELSESIYYGRSELAGYLADNGRTDEALTIFEEMVELFPETSDSRHYLGKIYFQKERYAEAAEQLEKSIEFAAKSQDSYHLLAIAYAKTGKFEQALLTSEQSLKNFPEMKYAYYEELGHIYYEKGDLHESAKKTIKMIENGGSPYVTYATIIGRFQLVNDTTSANLYLNQAISLGIMDAFGKAK